MDILKQLKKANKQRPYPVKQMGMRVPEAVFNQCVNACKKIIEEFEKDLKNNS